MKKGFYDFILNFGNSNEFSGISKNFRHFFEFSGISGTLTEF
jgi:hypothetical protein